MLALRLVDTVTSQVHQKGAGKAGKRAIRPRRRDIIPHHDIGNDGTTVTIRRYAAS
jgi:hypothetical protein